MWEGLNQDGGVFSTIFRTAKAHRKIEDFTNLNTFDRRRVSSVTILYAG